MAAYRRVDVTCGLTACTPGSAPGPKLGIGNEYGKLLPFLLTSKALRYGTCLRGINIVLPATHMFIHKWNEPSCLYSPAAEYHRNLTDTHFPSH